MLAVRGAKKSMGRSLIAWIPELRVAAFTGVLDNPTYLFQAFDIFFINRFNRQVGSILQRMRTLNKRGPLRSDQRLYRCGL